MPGMLYIIDVESCHVMSCLFLACSKDEAEITGECVEGPFCAVTVSQCCLQQSLYILLSKQDTDQECLFTSKKMPVTGGCCVESDPLQRSI